MCVDKCGTANVGTIESEEAFIALASSRVYRRTGCVELSNRPQVGSKSEHSVKEYENCFIISEKGFNNYRGADSPEEWIVSSASNLSNSLMFMYKQQITYSAFRFAIQPIHARQSINMQRNASRANGSGSQFEGYFGTRI